MQKCLDLMHSEDSEQQEEARVLQSVRNYLQTQIHKADE